MDLTQQKCVPCEGGIPPFTKKQIEDHLDMIDSTWEVIDDKKIKKIFKFKDFKEAIAWINKVADLAEEEGHHPNIHVFYNEVTIELWTHAINGLFKNDFILAAKIDEL